MQKNIILFLVFMLPFLVQSQELKIVGKIYDLLTEEPIENATIKIEGTNNFTTSDKNGNFSIMGNPNSQLEISHIGYGTKKVEAKDAAEIALTSQSISLDEILISTNPLEDITHSITIIDEMKKGSQPRNAAELFNDISGFSIQKRSATASEPSLRAFKYEQMNIKFDGSSKICPACPNRMDPITSHIIPEEVEKIEIVKGPYTVRFGQTFGGVINLVTSNKIESGLHGNIQAGYELNGENKMSRAEIQYAKEKFDITLNGEYRDFGDYTDGKGTLTPAGFNTVSYSVKTGIQPKDHHKLQLDWRQKFGKDIFHSGLPMDSPKDDSYAASLDYSIENLSKTITGVTLKSYYTSVDHLMTNTYRPNFVMMDAQTPVTSNSYGGKLEFTLRPTDKVLIYTGIDGEVIKKDGERTRIIKKNMMGMVLNPPLIKIDKVWQNATTQDLGVYAEATYKLATSFSITGGLRADYFTANIKDPAQKTAGAVMGTLVTGFEDLYGSSFNNQKEFTQGGNIGFKYHKNNTQVQLAYGLGVRSASMLERFIYHMSIGTDSYEYVGNPFLRPEKNNQIELAFNHKKDRLDIGVGVFYSLMNDFISAIYKGGDPNFAVVFANPKPFAKQFVNVDAYQQGFDAFFGYNLANNLFFNTSIAFTEAHNKTFDEALARISPFVANFSLKYETENFWTDVRTQVVSQQNRLAKSFDETEITPGHTTVDFRIGTRVFDGFNIGASVLNVFDVDYYNHLNFSYSNAFDHLNGEKVYEPGRNISFYVIYNF